MGRKLTPDLLVGFVAGYENFRYDSADLTGTIKGDGGTIGGYTAWRILSTLRWDATLAWSSISHDVAARAPRAVLSWAAAGLHRPD